MAACGEIPEPGRPPETISHLRKCDSDRKKSQHHSAECTNASNTSKNNNTPTDVFNSNYNLETDLFSSKETKSLLKCNNLEVAPKSPKLDIKSNCRQTLRKVFFKRQNNSLANCNHNNSNCLDSRMYHKKVDDGVVSRKTIITTVSQSVDESRTRKRYSFHQDVEEALNSLLWQPYEYQKSTREKASVNSSSYFTSVSNTASNSSDYCYDHRTSLCSSSCSSLSSSSGLEFSNNGTTRSGNTADLHLLVNNLRPHRLNQSRCAARSRDLTELKQHSTSTYLPFIVSAHRPNVVVESCRVPHNSNQIQHTHTTDNNHFALQCIGNEDPSQHCDVLRSQNSASTMRVEIQPSSIKSIITSGSSGVTNTHTNNSNNYNYSSSNDNNNGSSNSSGPLLLRTDNSQVQDAAGSSCTGASTNATNAISSTTCTNSASSTCIPPPPRNTRPTARNLSSVNVVGLPHNHPRQNSVPATLTITPTSTTTRSLVPNHSRNISEPYRGANSFISNPNCTINGNNYNGNARTNSNNNGANVVSLFNHRSGSGTRRGHPQHIAFTTNFNVGTSELIQCNNNTNGISTSSSSNNNIQTNNDILGVAGTNVGAVRTNSNNNNNNSSSRVPLNVSNVNVNYYRAVPVNVVSAVPTIECLNTCGGGGSNSAVAATSCTNVTKNQISTNNATTVTTATIGTTTDSNNVSNVNIVQAMPVSTSISSNNQNPIPMPTIGGGPTATTTCMEVIVHSTPTASMTPVIPATPSKPVQVVRTFTSTEAQTDDTAIPPPESTSASREQRRRERRERRHQRRLNNANHRHVNSGNTISAITTTNNNANTNNNVHQLSSHQFNQSNSNNNGQMPDLLNNTLPPPYNSTSMMQHSGQALTHNHTHHTHSHQLAHPHPHPPPGNIIVPPGTIVQSLVPNSLVPNGLVPNAMVPFHPQIVPGQVPLVQAAGAIPVPVPSPTGFRFPLPANGFRRSRYSEDPPKSCCGLLAWRPGSLRWFIALIALVAVCCVLVGTALGAMKPSGRDHLTVSLLMIGVGIILVTVSGIAWRLTSHDSSTCRTMLGLGSTESVEACPRRFVPRLPPSYGRPHHPYAAMMYPEFQYRPPPPSYQASMQEYRLRLLLLDRGSTPQIQAGMQNAVSPPPTYRSHSGSLLRVPLSNRRDASQSEYSCPPSYRSQNSSSRAAAMLQNNSIMHSREQSLSLSESNPDGSVVNVVNILSTNEEDIALDNITLDSLKLEPEELNPLKMLLKGSSSELEGTKDGNLVTIVQTNDQSPVIVTVSGSSHSDNCNTVQITEIPNEMEILAHL